MSDLTREQVVETLRAVMRPSGGPGQYHLHMMSLLDTDASLRSQLEASHKERVRFQKYYEAAGKLNGELKARLEDYETGKRQMGVNILQEDNAKLRAQLVTAQARVTQLESERDEVIRLSRFAVHDALLSTGHTKDEHTAAVFGQWKQAIDEALKAEARVRELEEAG